LRERPDDIISLAWYFINETSDRVHENWEMTEETMVALCAYNWPGNVRELRNTIRRACILATESVITSDLLPFSTPKILPPMPANGSHDAHPLPLWVIERAHIEKVLEQVEGNKSRAAKILEIDRKTLYTKLERYGING
jgi:two-component system NtrC family response regulator